MDKERLENFLLWFRMQTEEHWRVYETQNLKHFNQRGAGGVAWRKGTRWKSGLEKSEIDRIEADWKIAFPEEYRTFLSILNTPTKKQASFGWSKDVPSKIVQVADRPSFFDWQTDRDHICRSLDWPQKGLLFDVENNALWLENWGERPAAPEDRVHRLEQLIQAAPALIPIVGHRYLLDYELPTGRPVLSIHQSDIIIYGEDLATFLVNDFQDLLSEKPEDNVSAKQIDMRQVANIPFWGGLIE